MTVDEILNYPERKEEFSSLVRRRTNFKDVDDIINVVHNYRLTMYIEDSMNNLEKLEMKEIADFYDEYMISIGDPRRVYRIGV